MSPTERATRRVTFAVHVVQPLDLAIERMTMAESLEWCLQSNLGFGHEIIVVSDEDCPCVQVRAQNALLGAVHVAFSQHLPLTLSPDMVWLAMLQGFARHVKANAQALEGRMMKAPGKHQIRLEVTSAMTWPEVFENFATALQHHGGTWFRELESDFSTTGPVERAASHIALMDVFSPYVRYIMACICGIPSITLEGEVEDWQQLRGKLQRLRGFDADDWIDELDEIAGHFVSASAGNADRTWWQQIYKLTPEYGREIVEGWIGAFFPYLRDERRTFTHRKQRGESFSTEDVPPGLADVSVTCASREGSESLRMAAGFIGVEDRGSDGVRPKIGWAVLRDAFMERWVKEIGNTPGIETRAPLGRNSPIFNERPSFFRSSFKTLPIDLQLFYQATDGASLFGQGEIATCAVFLETTITDMWHYLGSWRDGSMLLANEAIVRAKCIEGNWQHQTLALSFSDFIARLLKAGGSAYWEAEDYIEPAIAPMWMTFQPPVPFPSDPAKACDELRRPNHGLRFLRWGIASGFRLLPPSSQPLDHLPEALARFYRVCGGLTHKGVCVLWEPHRAGSVRGTHGRWWEIGEARGGKRILLDVAADRGVVVLGEEAGEEHYAGHSVSSFLDNLALHPGEAFWIKDPAEPETMPRKRLFWPDEHPFHSIASRGEE
jgi:hypothetical protein